MATFVIVDDKHVPIYRIVWISALPHYCGDKDCGREGQYEIRLEQGEAVWANQEQRDQALAAVEEWEAAGRAGDDFED